MGARALVGRTLEDGSVEVYYSHWGAGNAEEAGEEKPIIPKKEPEEKTWVVKDKYAFGKEVDYLHHEAVWLDSQCYVPIWIFPSESVNVKRWKTEGQGILIKVDSGTDYNYYRAQSDKRDLLDTLTPHLTTKQKIEMMINEVVGSTTDGSIPDFSPLGYGVKYVSTKKFMRKVSLPMKKKGWQYESARHALARKGIATGRKKK